MLEDSVEERMEKTLSDLDKTEVEGNKEGDPEENNKVVVIIQFYE